jgi:hypothetical protein
MWQILPRTSREMSMFFPNPENFPVRIEKETLGRGVEVQGHVR